MTDPSAVVTTDLVTSFTAALNKPDTKLAKIKTTAGNSPWHAKAHAALTADKQTLLGRIEKLRAGIGKIPRNNQGVLNLSKEITAYGKKVDAAEGKAQFRTYKYGGTKVASLSALQAKVQSVLPDKAAKCAAQALAPADTAPDSKLKDAGKAGRGVKHSSAGKAAVKGESCTVFFTRELDGDGLETVLDVVAVGSHDGPSSYLIHYSSVSALKAGKVFSL